MTVDSSTQTSRVRRFGYGLSVAATVSILLILAPSTDAVRMAKVTPVAALVLLVMAAAGAIGARTGQETFYLAAGGVAIAAALIQLVQFGRSTNWVDGNGSTAALLASLGLGFCALFYASRPTGQPE